jgi:hypothetical protein
VICFASVCGSTLLAYAVHAVALCYRMLRMRLQIASVCAVCASNLLADAPHKQNRVKMSFCKRMLRMRLQIASLCGAYASKLLAQTAHTLAKSCKNEFLQGYAVHAVANC